MDRLTYERDFDGEWDKISPNREARKIEFEFDGDLDIWEFKTIMIRLAKALGYHDETIKEAVGGEDESPEELEAKERISNLICKDSAFPTIEKNAE